MQTGPQGCYISVSTWPATSLHPASVERGKTPPTQTQPVCTEPPPKNCQLPCCCWVCSWDALAQELLWKRPGRHLNRAWPHPEWVPRATGGREKGGRTGSGCPFFPPSQKKCTVLFDTKKKPNQLPKFPLSHSHYNSCFLASSSECCKGLMRNTLQGQHHFIIFLHLK